MNARTRKARHARRQPTPPASSRTFAHDLISTQLQVVRANEKKTARGEVEALHDMRVAIRRIRTLLNTFGAYLELDGAHKLEEQFDQLQKDLGPARDTDVLLRIMEKEISLEDAAVSEEQGAVLEHLRKLRSRYNRDVKGILAGEPYSRLKTATAQFMKEELLASEHEDNVSLQEIATGSLTQALARMKKRSHLSASFPPDKVHRFRISTRKARYLAEFFSPILGPDMDPIAKGLREVQDVLGDIHDTDVLVAGIRREYASPPKALAKDLRKRRKAQIREFSKSWERFTRPSFKKRVSRVLSADR